MYIVTPQIYIIGKYSKPKATEHFITNSYFQEYDNNFIDKINDSIFNPTNSLVSIINKNKNNKHKFNLSYFKFKHFH